MSFDPPAYARVAGDLRRRILTGELPPGAQVPSRSEICRRWGVSGTVAVRALGILAAEGLTEGRPGSGTFVRARPGVVPVPRMAPPPGPYSSYSRTTHAPPGIAARLGIDPGDRVMRTEYVHETDGRPSMLVTSWEPFAITGGQAILLPEEGPLAGRGVVERMAAIGVTVARVREVVGARTARGDEASRLGEAAGAMLVTVERTHLDVDGRAVETADVLAPAGRVAVAYEWPVP